MGNTCTSEEHSFYDSTDKMNGGSEKLIHDYQPGDPVKLHEVIEKNKLDHPEHYREGTKRGVTGEVVLSDSEMVELQEIFKMFDKDSSGSIDVHELETMVNSLGINASNDELLEMIAEADIDKSGTIEFDEFKTLIGPHFQKEKPPEDFIEAFKFFDKDGDGYISRSELRTIMNTVDGTLAESDIEEMVREADVNGDGKIDFEEFTKMMNIQ